MPYPSHAVVVRYRLRDPAERLADIPDVQRRDHDRDVRRYRVAAVTVVAPGLAADAASFPFPGTAFSDYAAYAPEFPASWLLTDKRSTGNHRGNPVAGDKVVCARPIPPVSDCGH